MEKNRQIRIFDTTLRDGQQCPGAGMSFEHNLEYAELACEVGVDVMEAGFPSASALDYKIVNTIASEFSSRLDCPIIAGLCQLREEQVDKTIEALFPAIRYQKALLHVYLPVGEELMAASLGVERAENKKQLVKEVYDYILKASQAGLEVEFSPEGYSQMKSNFDFTTDCIRAAVEAGATVINCPDTIGGACEFEGEEYFVEKMNRHAAIIAKEYPGRSIIWSAHCHNDFGLAVQNSINAVFRGPVTQVEGCFNGVGERAGNAALEQVIMIIKHFAHKQNSKNPFYTKIKTEYIQKISDFVSKNMLARQACSPIVGENAVKHTAGGHTNAMLKNPLAYQPFDPQEVGREISFIFGPLSGGNHAKSVIENKGYHCADAEKATIAQYIKNIYSDRRKGITDAELLNGYFSYREPIKLDNLEYSKSENKAKIKAEGSFFSKSGMIIEEIEGKDSALAALKKAIEKNFDPFSVENYRSKSDSSGIEARSISKIVIKDSQGLVFDGTGIDQDIEISSMKALIAAVNKAFIEKNYRKNG